MGSGKDILAGRDRLALGTNRPCILVRLAVAAVVVVRMQGARGAALLATDGWHRLLRGLIPLWPFLRRTRGLPYVLRRTSSGCEADAGALVEKPHSSWCVVEGPRCRTPGWGPSSSLAASGVDVDDRDGAHRVLWPSMAAEKGRVLSVPPS